METPSPDLLDKIRQQFEFAPYPRVPVEDSPKENYNLLYLHSLVTPYYLRNQRFIDTKDKIILDAGCGTGYKSLMLALANPGAKIVGVDLSENAINLARQRLQYHGVENAEFHVLSIEDIPKLGMAFDYINCDEVLYLFNDIAAILQIFQAVLKPEGIIRTNLHSAMQRVTNFRAQKLFTLMGLMEGNPEEFELEVVKDTMEALKDTVNLKASTWNAQFQGEKGKDTILMNYLFQGDKGYTIPEIFTALESANLEFISMVNWRQWDLLDLFKEADNLPAFWAMGLAEATTEDKLHIFELLHPIHRLLDFWCASGKSEPSLMPVAEWEETDWKNAQVHLHPQLRTEKAKEDLLECIATQRPFEISSYIPAPTTMRIVVESSLAACFLPLWESSQPFTALVENWLKIHPVNPVTLEPTAPEVAFKEIQEKLSDLEAFLYILLERSV